MPHGIEKIASIVVCEDDAATLDLLCDHLTADRFEVLPAPSAADALRLCRYNHPDRMILDLAPAVARLRPATPAPSNTGVTNAGLTAVAPAIDSHLDRGMSFRALTLPLRQALRSSI